MKYVLYFFAILVMLSCRSTRQLRIPSSSSGITGNQFYHEAFAMQWKQRDSFAVKEILSGNIPSFLRRLVPVHVSGIDSINGKNIRLTYYVMPDYLSIGNNNDWARISLTPLAAQLVADSFQCFLPTRKMVDAIYNAATVKLEPVPMYAFRDSTVTMWHHHLIIEGQRKGKKGLIAGIKKDVVLSNKVADSPHADRVAIYGWHKLDGKPIQPLYAGHVNWYADYSHGIRLVYDKIRVNKKWMNYKDVLKDPVLQKLLCDEGACSFYRYPLSSQ